MRAPWSHAVNDATMRLVNERAEVAAFRRNLAVVEARNSQALTYVRDKQREITSKAARKLTDEDTEMWTALVAVEYLLSGRGEEQT